MNDFLFFLSPPEPMSMKSEEEEALSSSLDKPSMDADHVRGKRRHNALRDIADDVSSNHEEEKMDVEERTLDSNLEESTEESSIDDEGREGEDHSDDTVAPEEQEAATEGSVEGGDGHRVAEVGWLIGFAAKMKLDGKNCAL